MAKQWTPERISLLIEAVENRPCLYNTKLKEYFNRDIKHKSFMEISSVLELPGKILSNYIYIYKTEQYEINA